MTACIAAMVSPCGRRVTNSLYASMNFYCILNSGAVALIAALPFLSGADPYIIAPFLSAVVYFVTVGASTAAAYDHTCKRIAGMLLLHQLRVCPFLPNRLCAVEGFLADDAFMGIFDVISLTVAAI